MKLSTYNWEIRSYLKVLVLDVIPVEFIMNMQNWNHFLQISGLVGLQYNGVKEETQLSRFPQLHMYI